MRASLHDQRLAIQMLQEFLCAETFRGPQLVALTDNTSYMIQNGTLLLVDDDFDDQEMITTALQDLGFKHETVVFSDAESALKYLYSENKKPFLIVSDINMPKIDGLAFKESIEVCPTLSEHRIPFVFLSTAASTNYLRRAYQLRAQGYFQKGSTFDSLKASLRTILQYWSECMQPAVHN